MLKDDEQRDDLGRGLSIIQKRKGFKYGTDSVLLAKFALMSEGIIPGKKKTLSCADFGTGTGILPLLLSRDERIGKIVGYEIQQDYAEMAERSVEENGLADRIEIVCGDIKDAKGCVDVIVTNPPYKRSGSGIPSDREDEYTARHETTATLEDFVFTASKMLETGGAFFMINRPERLADTMEYMRKYKVEPKVLRMVLPKVSKQPSMFLVAGVKDGGKNLRVERPLVLMDENGNETDEVKEIYEF